MGCGKAKPKPVVVPESNIISNKTAQAKRYFAQDMMEPKDFIDGNQYKPANIVNYDVEDQDFRDENYGVVQGPTASRVKKLEPQEILSYEIDKPNGVSQIAQINTFSYDSALSHNLNLNNKNQGSVIYSRLRTSKMSQVK